jgi:hypothetical protein
MALELINIIMLFTSTNPFPYPFRPSCYPTSATCFGLQTQLAASLYVIEQLTTNTAQIDLDVRQNFVRLLTADYPPLIFRNAPAAHSRTHFLALLNCVPDSAPTCSVLRKTASENGTIGPTVLWRTHCATSQQAGTFRRSATRAIAP